EALDCFQKAMSIEPTSQTNHSNFLYTLQFCPGITAAELYEHHRRWNEQFAVPLGRNIAPHANDRDTYRRLRIGYVSPDFRSHCQAFFTVPLLSHHDHEQFEIVCYSDVRSPDAMTERLQRYADLWRTTNKLSDEELARLIREDRIDVLVDLTM